jgi:hypothetical protein
MESSSAQKETGFHLVLPYRVAKPYEAAQKQNENYWSGTAKLFKVLATE